MLGWEGCAFILSNLRPKPSAHHNPHTFRLAILCIRILPTLALRGFVSRNKHRAIVAQMEANKKELVSFLERMNTNLQRMNYTLKGMCEYDEKVMTDRALQQEQERRRQEAERARKKREEEEAERRRQEEAMQRVREELEAAEREQLRMRQQLDDILGSKVRERALKKKETIHEVFRQRDGCIVSPVSCV
jgi:Fe2+ transport system protein B